MKTDHDLFAAFLEHLLAAMDGGTERSDAFAEMAKTMFKPRGEAKPMSDDDYEGTLQKMIAEMPAFLADLKSRPVKGFPEN
jgi:hypothetical protein